MSNKVFGTQKFITRLAALFVALAVLVVGLPAVSVKADMYLPYTISSKLTAKAESLSKKKAKTLTVDEDIPRWDFIDLDKNKKAEMLYSPEGYDFRNVKSNVNYSIEVYVYSSKKVKKIATIKNVVDLRKSSGKLLVKTKKGKVTEYREYVLKSNKLSAKTVYKYDGKTKKYTKNGKKIAKKTYKAYVSKFKAKKIKRLDYSSSKAYSIYNQKVATDLLKEAFEKSAPEKVLSDKGVSGYTIALWKLEDEATISLYADSKDLVAIDSITATKKTLNYGGIGKFELKNFSLSDTEVVDGYQKDTEDVDEPYYRIFTQVSPDYASRIYPGYTFPSDKNPDDYTIQGVYMVSVATGKILTADFYLDEKEYPYTQLYHVAYTFASIVTK